MPSIDIHVLCIATSDPDGVLQTHAAIGSCIGSMIVFLAIIVYGMPKHTRSLNQPTSLPAANSQWITPKKYSYPPFYVMGGALMADFFCGAFGGSLGASASSQSLAASIAGGVVGAIIGIGGIWLMHKVDNRLCAKGYFNFQPNAPAYSRAVVRILATFCIMLLIPIGCAIIALGLSIALFQPSLLHFL
jgi:hypothetical protein